MKGFENTRRSFILSYNGLTRIYTDRTEHRRVVFRAQFNLIIGYAFDPRRVTVNFTSRTHRPKPICMFVYIGPLHGPYVQIAQNVYLYLDSIIMLSREKKNIEVNRVPTYTVYYNK